MMGVRRAPTSRSGTRGGRGGRGTGGDGETTRKRPQSDSPSGKEQEAARAEKPSITDTPMLANEGNQHAEDNTLAVVPAASGKPPLPPSPVKSLV
jgi:hypothetical protein